MKVLILLIGFIPSSFTHFFDIRDVPNKHIVKGFEYLQKEDFFEAFDEFTIASKLVDEQRERALAEFGLGITSFYLRDTAFCFKHLKRALDFAPTSSDSAQVVSWLVYAYHEFGLDEQAIQTIHSFKDYLWLEDTKLLALTYLNAGMPDSALRYVDGDDAENIYLRGFCYFSLGQYDAALAEFQKIIDQGISAPLYPDAVYMVGECFYRQGKYLESAQTFEKLAYVYTGAPVSQKAIYASAYSYYAVGMYAKADSLLESLIEWYRPKGRLGVEVKLLRAVAIMRRVEGMAWDAPQREALILKARKLLDDIQMPPYDLEDDIVLEKARTYYALWQHKLALELYLEGLKFGGSEHINEFYFEGGRAAYYAGEYETCIRLLSYVLKNQQYSYSASYYIGVALYTMTSNGDTALPYLRYAASSPKRRIRALAYRELGEIFAAQGAIDSAITAYENSLKAKGLLRSEKDELVYHLERLRFQRGDYPDLYSFAVNFAKKHKNNRFTLSVLKEAFEFYKATPSALEAILSLAVEVAPTDTAVLSMLFEAMGHIPAYKIADFADTVLNHASRDFRKYDAEFFLKLGDLFDRIHINNLADSSYRIALSLVDVSAQPELAIKIYYLIGRQRIAMSDQNGAAIAFGYAFELSKTYGIVPSYAYELFSSYIWVLVQAGKREVADSVAHQAIRMLPEGDERIRLINYCESIGISVISGSGDMPELSANSSDSLVKMRFRGVQPSVPSSEDSLMRTNP